MNQEKINRLLEHSVENINETVKFLVALQNKEIQHLSSGMSHLDKVLLGGLFPDLIISIVARAANGKSYTINRIRNAILSDKSQDIGLLFYNLEMPFFTLLLVELKKILKKSLRFIIDNPPSQDDLLLYKEVTDQFRDPRLTKIDETVSPQEFYEVTKAYIERNKHKKQLFILLDHIGIIKGKNKTESIHETMEYINMLKLEYPRLLTFIVLGQMNREIEARWRQKDANPTQLIPDSSSVFGSDSVMFFSDIVMAQVIPQSVGMEEKYASVNKERYSYLSEHFTDEGTQMSKYARLRGDNRIYYHFLKVRLQDGEPTLYCEILNQEQEELTRVHGEFESNTTDFEVPVVQDLEF